MLCLNGVDYANLINGSRWGVSCNRSFKCSKMAFGTAKVANYLCCWRALLSLFSVLENEMGLPCMAAGFLQFHKITQKSISSFKCCVSKWPDQSPTYEELLVATGVKGVNHSKGRGDCLFETTTAAPKEVSVDAN